MQNAEQQQAAPAKPKGKPGRPRTNKADWVPPPGYSHNPNTIKVHRWKMAHRKQPPQPLDPQEELAIMQAPRHLRQTPEKFAAWIDTWTTPEPHGEPEDMDAAGALFAAVALDEEEAAREEAETRAAQLAAQREHTALLLAAEPQPAASQDGGQEAQQDAQQEGQQEAQQQEGVPGVGAVPQTVEDGRRRGHGKAALSFSPHLTRFRQAMLIGLGGIARGLPAVEYERRSGLSWSRLRMLCTSDRKCAQKLWDKAWAEREGMTEMRLREKAVSRALDGDAVPLVGRIGKDQDGIIGERRQYSDRILEMLLTGGDKPGGGRAGEDKARVNNLNIGSITYVLPTLPAYLGGGATPLPPARQQQQAAAPAVIDVEPGR